MNEVIVPLSVRDKVNIIEAEMRKYPQLDIPVAHYFANAGTKRGTYAREITIPKDSYVTGKIHKYEQINFLLKGEISVLTEDGMKRIKAPATVVSPAGTKRIAYTHEECIWTTIHSTEETDVDKIEETFIAQTDAEYLEFRESLEKPLCLG
jgi:quercetin dioxygenase-like cupin family protein